MEEVLEKMTIEKYPAYKDSGVEWLGEIPEGWQVKRLKYIFSITKRIAGELGHDILSITQEGIKIKDVDSGEGQLSMDYSKYQLVYRGDFAMNHMDLLTGYVDISKYNGVISPDYRVFRINNLQFCKKYFLYLLQFGYKNKIFYAHGQGVSMLGRWRFPAENFNNFLFPVPHKDEQTAIANFLDNKTAQIDKAISIKEKQIELLKERRQILIHNAVTRGLDRNVKMKDSGVEWIGEIPEGWEVKRLGILADVIDPQPDHRAPKIDDNGLPYLGIRDINYDGSINIHTARMVEIKAVEKQERAFTLNDGDILFGKVGTLGNPKRVKLGGERVALSATLVIIKSKRELLTMYLKYALDSVMLYNQIQRIITGATRPALGIQQIRKFEIVIPTESEFENVVKQLEDATSRIANAISLKEQEIGKLKEYKATLINSAVTGKIKVG